MIVVKAEAGQSQELEANVVGTNPTEPPPAACQSAQHKKLNPGSEPTLGLNNWYGMQKT